MIELPLCRWRRKPTVKGYHRCASTKLQHGRNGVKDELCKTCYLRDHPKPPWYEWLRGRWLRFKGEWPARYRRYRRFAEALLKHVLAGFPRATTQDIAARRKVCDPCWRRDKKTDQCTLCGCKLASRGGKKDLISKLAWAGEQCPEYDPVKRPGQYWGPVKGETIWRRSWNRIIAGLDRLESWLC